MKKELAKKENTEVAVMFDDSALDKARADVNVTSENILLPHLLPMQGQTPHVLSGDHVFGDIVNMVTGEVMANAAFGKKEMNPLTFTPILIEEYWRIEKVVNGKNEFHTYTPMTIKNNKLEDYGVYEEKGNTFQRFYTFRCFILVKDSPLPITIEFRKSSKKSGKSLFTQMYISNLDIVSKDPWRRFPFGTVMELRPFIKTNDKGTFTVLEIRPLRPSTKEEATKAFKWLEKINSGKVKVNIVEDEPQTTQDQDFANDNVEF